MKLLALLWAGLFAQTKDLYIVSQGGLDVVNGDVDAFAYTIPEDSRSGFFDDPKRIESTLYSLINMKLIRRYAENQETEFLQEINQALANVQASVAGEAYDPDFLTKHQYTTDTFRWHRQNLETNKLIYKLLQQHYIDSVPDEQVAEFAYEKYMSTKSTYISKPKAVASHLLIKFDQNNRAEKKALAKTLLQQLIAGEANFADHVKNYSEADFEESTEGDALGHLGEFEEGVMVKEFNDAVFSVVEPGIYPEVVETMYGFHLIKVEQVMPARQQTFEEVKQSLMTSLKFDVGTGNFQSILTKVSKAEIKANEALIMALRERYL